MNSGEEAREKNVMTQLLEMLKGQRQEDPERKKYPTPVKNGNFAFLTGVGYFFLSGSSCL